MSDRYIHMIATWPAETHGTARFQLIRVDRETGDARVLSMWFCSIEQAREESRFRDRYANSEFGRAVLAIETRSRVQSSGAIPRR